MEDFTFDEIHENFLEPALRLWQGEAPAEAAGDLLRHLGPVLRETGRQVFTNGNITVNLLPVIAAALALGALLLKLFFGLTIFDVMDAMTGSTYGHGYSGADSGYSAPSTGGGYAAPSAGYEAAAGYSSRASHFGDGEEEVQLTPEQRSLYPELAKLQDDINRLKESELQLRNQIFYNNPAGDLAGAAAAQIGFSY